MQKDSAPSFSVWSGLGQWGWEAAEREGRVWGWLVGCHEKGERGRRRVGCRVGVGGVLGGTRGMRKRAEGLRAD